METSTPPGGCPLPARPGTGSGPGPTGRSLTSCVMDTSCAPGPRGPRWGSSGGASLSILVRVTGYGLLKRGSA